MAADQCAGHRAGQDTGQMIHDRFLEIVAGAPASSGLVETGILLPYTELAERVGRVAAGFAAHGVGPGDVVAMLLPNGPALFTAVHALFAIGAVAMPLGAGMTAPEVIHAARKAGLRGILADPERAALAAEVAEGLEADAPVTVFLAGGDGSQSLAALERSAPLAQLPKVAPDAPALYLLSSGSTGLPKIVPHTHRELLADAHRTSTAWALQPDDIVFNMLPGNFAMGLLLGAMDALAVGATTVYWSDPRPLLMARRRLLDDLIGQRVTVMGAVPAMYEALCGTPGDEQLTSMRLAFSGGAGLGRAVFERFRDRFGLPLRQAYGSTEAIMISHNDAEDIDVLWDSVGRPAGDAEVRIAPRDTGLGDDVGELMVRSSSLTAGYLGEDEANRASFEDGWLLTGDLARLDADGRIFIKGRSKLLIEVSGYKIDPFEVEEVLQLHPAVAEAAVVGARPSPGAAAQLKAFVVRDGDVAPDQLIRFARERLSTQKVPSLVAFVDALPKSSTGKILRGKLSADG